MPFDWEQMPVVWSIGLLNKSKISNRFSCRSDRFYLFSIKPEKSREKKKIEAALRPFFSRLGKHDSVFNLLRKSNITANSTRKTKLVTEQNEDETRWTRKVLCAVISSWFIDSNWLQRICLLWKDGRTYIIFSTKLESIYRTTTILYRSTKTHSEMSQLIMNYNTVRLLHSMNSILRNH